MLTKLRLLNEAGANRNDPRAFRALAGKLHPGLFITVADMRASDLKTDLDTAVFLFEKVSREWPSVDISTADCRREREDIYLPLCASLRGGTARQLLLAKAWLHARWAEAAIAHYKGGGDAETVKTLSAVRAARGIDMVIAARAVETLRRLEGLVNIYPAYADYPEGRAATGVGPDELEGQFADVLGRAGLLIASLPRSPVFYHLSNAHHSYRDGLFWSRRIYRSRKLVVSALKPFDRDLLKDLGLDAKSAGYAAAACWRKAVEYSRLAEQSLPKAVH